MNLLSVHVWVFRRCLIKMAPWLFIFDIFILGGILS